MSDVGYSIPQIAGLSLPVRMAREEALPVPWWLCRTRKYVFGFLYVCPFFCTPLSFLRIYSCVYRDALAGVLGTEDDAFARTLGVCPLGPKLPDSIRNNGLIECQEQCITRLHGLTGTEGPSK